MLIPHCRQYSRDHGCNVASETSARYPHDFQTLEPGGLQSSKKVMAVHIEKETWPTEEGEFVKPLVEEVKPREYKIVYPMLLVLVYWHIGALYGLYLSVTSAKWPTLLLNFTEFYLSALGVSAGSHRLWSHRAFKATMPLQVLLMLFHTLAGQQSAIQWARDHRVHHKYCDTDADPHNSKRGLFFSHFGWLLVRKHPDLVRSSKNVDISDLLNNPVLQFQKKYYLYLTMLLVHILPTLIPMYFWQETFNTAYHVSMLRLVFGSNVTFALNSIAHKFGNKPYDKTQSAIENVPLSLVTLGEGYHNFHHAFPYDYRVSELSKHFKFSTHFIDFFARLGWAYDLKCTSDEMILRRVTRTGDGTHESIVDSNIWGWGDKDMMEEEKASIIKKYSL